MRRQTPNVHRLDELLGSDQAADAYADSERIITLCEPLVSDQRKARLQSVIARRLDSVTVVLDGPHDPHNGAAVIRSCDAFGVQHLRVIERYEPFLMARSVAKSAEQWVDMHLYPSTEPLLDAIAPSRSDDSTDPNPACAMPPPDGAAPFELIATDPKGELLPSDLRDIPKLALVVGNEREGIAPDLRQHCRRAVRVPMAGFVDSLNLSVATAILLYAAVEGRSGDLPVEERRRLYARGLYLTVPRAAEVLLAARRRP